jgi:Fe-S cluster assembly protein SufD
MIESPTKQAAKGSDAFWEKFEQVERATAECEPSWLTAWRKAAISRFAEIGFPTLKDEDWRFTNVAPIAKLPFHPAVTGPAEGVSLEKLAGFPFASLDGSKLTFVDGHFAPELSRIVPQSGVTISNVAAALKTHGHLIEKHWTQDHVNGRNPFPALNAAFFTDGAFIHVPAGQRVSRPVQVLHISTATQNGNTAHPRHLIIAEKDSEVTVIENYLSIGTAAHFTNAVTELFASDGAKVEHCKVQDEGLTGYHLATIHADLGRNCNVIAHSFALGAKLSRNNIRTVLGGEGIECILNGLYLTKDDQLADHYMIVEHAQPHCNSHEYFNGILDGRSKGVFHGRILVRPDAQKTDAKQTNKNLLLTDDASVDTKPQLEIYADDVKCTHGATIGQLNDESIFYLRARGIGKETARRMLMHAFAGEIIDRIRHTPVREELDRLIWEELEQSKQFSMAN